MLHDVQFCKIALKYVFPKAVTAAHSLQQGMYDGLSCFTSLSALVIRPAFSLNNIVVMKWTFTLVLLHVSLMTNEVRYLFIYLLFNNL